MIFLGATSFVVRGYKYGLDFVLASARILARKSFSQKQKEPRIHADQLG